MKKTLLIAGAALALSIAGGTASAKHHEKSGMEHGNAALHSVLMHERRAKDKARDKYRNPGKTLQFFGVKPEQTVVEYGPGGGWYTRVLLPYVAEAGKYIAVSSDTSTIDFSSRSREGRAKTWPERFPDRASEWTGVDAKKIVAFESDEFPDEMKGKVDRILVFRSLHGMMNGTRADSELRFMRAMLKDDGMIGVVQHRAKSDDSFAMSKGTRGYLKQDSIIALFKLNGFELVKASEINANPKDVKNYPNGVWTLPPVRRFDKENDTKYQAIGESDRMTLLFRKAK